jgi:hypothetical protein
MPGDDDVIIRKTVSLPASLWRQIEDFQFDARVKRDTQAVRQLIEMGLQAYARTKAAPRKAKAADD